MSLLAFFMFWLVSSALAGGAGFYLGRAIGYRGYRAALARVGGAA